MGAKGVDLIKFSRTFAFAMPRSMVVKGLPRAYPPDVEPMIRRVCFKHGFANRQWLADRLELHYSKIAIGPRLKHAPRNLV